MGGVDDEAYAKECYDLVEQLHLENVLFTGRVDIVSYMEKLDFTILTSISEGQPLSVLESFAARRPCVTTDVGCCRELWREMRKTLLELQGIVCLLCTGKGLHRLWIGCVSLGRADFVWAKNAQKRVEAYYRKEGMVENTGNSIRRWEEADGRNRI